MSAALPLPTGVLSALERIARLVSHTGHLESPRWPPCALPQILGGSVPWPSQAQRWAWQVGSSRAPPFHPFSRWLGSMFPFFLSHGTSPDCHDFLSIKESGLMYLSTSDNSLRTLGFHRVPQTYVHSGSPGGHGPDPHLEWEWLCFPSPQPAVHPLERCGKRGNHWLKRKSLVSQPSPCVLLPVCQSVFIRGCTLPLVFLFCLINLLKPFFLLFASFAKFSSPCALVFWALSLNNQVTSP